MQKATSDGGSLRSGRLGELTVAGSAVVSGRILKRRSVRLRKSVVIWGVCALGVWRAEAWSEEGRIETAHLCAHVSVVRPELSHVVPVAELLVLRLVETEQVSDTLLQAAGDFRAELAEKRSCNQSGRTHQGETGCGA